MISIFKTYKITRKQVHLTHVLKCLQVSSSILNKKLKPIVVLRIKIPFNILRYRQFYYALSFTITLISDIVHMSSILPLRF